jgi:hypothetical protein
MIMLTFESCFKFLLMLRDTKRTQKEKTRTCIKVDREQVSKLH